MDHDVYWGFSRFWWLIFPLFWMILALARGWSRHARANRALDIVKSYADQGKDPPPELLKSLQGGTDGYCGWGGRDWRGDGWRYSPERRLHRTILFFVLAVAFGVLTFWNFDDSGHWHHTSGLLIPAVVFAALAFSNFLSLMFLRRGLPPDDRDRR
jgi:hypothetical protein